MSKQMRAVFTLIDYSLNEQLSDIYKKAQMPLSFVTHGYGMADSSILEYLGFGENKKLVSISLLTRERTQYLFSTLASDMQLDQPGRGIAFSIPISSMSTFLSSLIELDHTQNTKLSKEDHSIMAHTYTHELIVTIITKGMFAEVKNAASAAGAKGGTLIHALGLGSEEAQKFLGISIQPEKDIILMVVRREDKNKVMQAIAEVGGINTQGRGILFSLPVDCAIGLSEVVLPNFNDINGTK